MMKRLLVSFSGLCLAVALFAAPASTSNEFLNSSAFDWRACVSPPPAEDSLAGQADHEIVRELDAHRTSDQTVLAKHYEKFSPFVIAADVLGDWCTADNLPRTKAFFSEAWLECKPVISDSKAAWNRKRPYSFDPDLHPVVERPNDASYPSGHAFSASYVAALLTAILPDHAADWEKEAQLIRWSRLVGGAHYPTDVVAGKILGEAVAKEMLKSPNMQKAIEEVRAELKPHLIKKGA